jgi:hypothetical protein
MFSSRKKNDRIDLIGFYMEQTADITEYTRRIAPGSLYGEDPG